MGLQPERTADTAPLKDAGCTLEGLSTFVCVLAQAGLVLSLRHPPRLGAGEFF